MKELQHLKGLKQFTLITNARGGSDFLQSLLDGHPEICVFNLNFRFFTEYLPTSQIWTNENVRPCDFIDEFIGRNIERFVSFYNSSENQDCLGLNKTESVMIDTSLFKEVFLRILEKSDATLEEIFLAIYGAYHIALGRNLYETKIFFHHAHNIAEAVEYKKHFSTVRLLISTRDPRTAYVSANQYARLPHNEEFDNYRNFYISLCQTVIEDPVQNSVFGVAPATSIPYGPSELSSLMTVDTQPLFVRLEDIPKREILYGLADFLGIKFHDSMDVSTWGGLEWWGDRFSTKQLSPRGWKANRTYNGWHEKLSAKDIIVFETCLYDILVYRGYEAKRIHPFKIFLAFLLIFLPFRYELRYLNPLQIARRCMQGRRGALHALSFPYFYLKVRSLMFKFLMAQVGGVWARWPGVVLQESIKNDS